MIGTIALCPTWTPGRLATGRTSRSVDIVRVHELISIASRSRRHGLLDGKVPWVNVPYAAVQPSRKGPADEENDPVVHHRARERVTTHRCQWMLDGTNHIRSRTGPGVGDPLTVVRAEQLRPEPIDATIDADIANGERVPHQLPRSAADQVGHAHAHCHVYAHRDTGPHRHGDARNG